MKRIIILFAVFSMVICSCNREENTKTVSKSGSGAAVDNSETEAAVSDSAAREENELATQGKENPLCLESITKKI